MMQQPRISNWVELMQQIQACEALNLDYSVERVTRDYGNVEYDLRIRDLDVAQLLHNAARRKLPVNPDESPSELVQRLSLNQ